MRPNDPSRLKDLLTPAGRRLGIDEPATKIWRDWTEIVGDDVAVHAEPTSLRNGVLRIRTDSTVWATEIGYLGDEIARRAREVTGAAVSEVRVWTSPEPIRARRRAAVAQRVEQPVTKTRGGEPMDAFRRAWEAWSRRRRGSSS